MATPRRRTPRLRGRPASAWPHSPETETRALGEQLLRDEANVKGGFTLKTQESSPAASEKGLDGWTVSGDRPRESRPVTGSAWLHLTPRGRGVASRSVG